MKKNNPYGDKDYFMATISYFFEFSAIWFSAVCVDHNGSGEVLFRGLNSTAYGRKRAKKTKGVTAHRY